MKPGCACVTPRPIRWAWSIIPIISSGSRWDASSCCGSWAFPTATWRARTNRFIAVAEAKCRYRAPVRYDEEVLVRTQLLNVRDSVVHFGYELRRAEDGTLLAEGETTHIVTDAEMKIAALPEKYLKAFRAALGKQDGKLS